MSCFPSVAMHEKDAVEGSAVALIRGGQQQQVILTK